jgi:hypothetical protein
LVCFSKLKTQGVKTQLKGQKTEQMVNHSFPHGRTYLIILGGKPKTSIKKEYMFSGKKISNKKIAVISFSKSF